MAVTGANIGGKRVGSNGLNTFSFQEQYLRLKAEICRLDDFVTINMSVICFYILLVRNVRVMLCFSPVSSFCSERR